MYYCSVNCQKNDWKQAHKLECGLFQEDAKRMERLILSGNFVRLILRLYLIVNHDSTIKKVKYSTFNGGQRCFNDLMDHCENLYLSTARWKFFNSVAKKLHQIRLNFDEKNLFSLFGKIVINSFSILNLSLNKIGTGIYISASAFNHSCRPNCDAIFDGTKLEIRAMQKFDSNKMVPTITYIDLKLSKEKRKAKLKEQYFFDCNCDRCFSDSEDVVEDICQLNKQFDDLIDEKKWKEAYILGIKTLPLYEKVYPTYYSDFTIQLLRVAKVLSNIDVYPSLDGFNFIMNKLYNSILITHGKDHSLYKDVFMKLIKISDD